MRIPGTWGKWGDRKHWELFAWRFRITRWCPGAPCRLEEVRQERHWVHINFE